MVGSAATTVAAMVGVAAASTRSSSATVVPGVLDVVVGAVVAAAAVGPCSEKLEVEGNWGRAVGCARVGKSSRELGVAREEDGIDSAVDK
jgi:hypothetical protein